MDNALTDQMRDLLPPGGTVTTVLRHVSPSGMTRGIDAYALQCDPDHPGRVIRSWLSYRVAAVLGWRFDGKRECVKVSGAGMDMGFHLVYSLSRRLYRDGFDCIGERCPSNDHSNGMPRNRAQWPTVPNGAGSWDTLRPHHADGGYALRQEWL